MNQHGGFMRRVFGSVTTAAALAGLLSTALPAAAATVSIDLSTQRMHVEGDGGRVTIGRSRRRAKAM